MWQESLTIFLGYALIAGRIGKGDVLVADIGELKKLDASEIHLRRINAKEVLTPRRREDFIFPVEDATAKLSGRDHEFQEPTLRQEQLGRSEDLRENFKTNRKGLYRQK